MLYILPLQIMFIVYYQYFCNYVDIPGSLEIYLLG